ncbi:GNAT family protein [Micromonospora arborensis]|uniref:GNAT family N-acetyltransferase n=1 Tax=Micromonospora arborensis TaxID=2116518 RepID=UPI0033C0CACF
MDLDVGCAEPMITIRPYTSADVIFARQHLSGPDAGDAVWFGYSSPRLQAAFDANGLLSPDSGRLIVDQDGEAVGSVEWSKDSWGPAGHSWCWEIGILLRKDARGRGIGTQAQALLRDYLFNHTRAERLQAITDVENIAEQRALEKAGFSQEGRVRSAQWRAGRWHDQYLYACIRSDWQR